MQETSPKLGLRRWGVVLVAALVLGVSATAPAGNPHLEDILPPSADGPAWMFVSFTEDFVLEPIDRINGGVRNQCTDMGSLVLPVLVGTFLGGPTTADGRYVGADLSAVDVTGLPPDVDNNQVTVVGTYLSTDDGMFHMVSPDFNPIPPDVQEAVGNALPLLETAILVGEICPLPTTAELTVFICDNGGVDVDPNAVQQSLFATPIRLDCTTCNAEGGLLGHEDPPVELFTLDITIDTVQNTVEVDICMIVEIDIKPGSDPNSVNLNSEGVIPIAVLTTSSNPKFDAPGELDVQTFTAVCLDADGNVICSLPPVKDAVQDVDGDGDDDIIVHFDTQALVAAELLEETTVTINFEGVTFGGTCVIGSDTVRIVPPNK